MSFRDVYRRMLTKVVHVELRYPEPALRGRKALDRNHGLLVCSSAEHSNAPKTSFLATGKPQRHELFGIKKAEEEPLSRHPYGTGRIYHQSPGLPVTVAEVGRETKPVYVESRCLRVQQPNFTGPNGEPPSPHFGRQAPLRGSVPPTASSMSTTASQERVRVQYECANDWIRDWPPRRRAP